MNDLAIEWQTNKQALSDSLKIIRGGWFVDERELMEYAMGSWVATRGYVDDKIAAMVEAVITYRSTLNRLDELYKLGAERAFYEWQHEILMGGN